MKKYTVILLVLVLTATVLMGCGCRKNMPMDTMPTTEMTKPTTAPTTQPTTAPTTRPSETTLPTGETYDNGNGPLPTDDTGAAGENSRTRRIPGDSAK